MKNNDLGSNPLIENTFEVARMKFFNGLRRYF